MHRLVFFISLLACRDHPEPVTAGVDRPRSAIRESSAPAEAGPDTLTPGTWFTVATNPNPDYYDKVVIDYLRVTVEPGGSVVRIRQNGRKTETERGTWVPGPGPQEATLTFDLGPQVGRQSWTWRLEPGGRAREVHWKNLTTGREYTREQDLYVLEGSLEWERRGKIRLNDEPVPANGWPSRPAVGTPERVFVDYLKAWSRHDWSGMAALSSSSWLAGEPDPAGEIEARLRTFTPVGARAVAREPIAPHIVRIVAVVTFDDGHTRELGIRINREASRWGVFKHIVQFRE